MRSLSAITKQIINPEIHYGDVRDGCVLLKYFFYSVAEFQEIDTNNDHIITPNGLAVSPYSAAFCIIDFQRTRKFLLALKTAIEDKLQQNPDKPVVVFYAGTGPFATLVTPLTTMFTPKELQLVLLEINTPSIYYLKNTIASLNIEDYILDIINADATTYRIKEHQMPNILLSETMRPGLIKEPQVSIISNLLVQCNKDTIIIPELITVDAILKAKRKNEGNNDFFIQNLIQFDKKLATLFAKERESIPIFTSGIIINIEQLPAPKFTQLAVSTFIKLYKSIYINPYESSLTIPHIISQTTDFIFPQKFNVKYVIGNSPKFEFSTIN